MTKYICLALIATTTLFAAPIDKKPKKKACTYATCKGGKPCNACKNCKYCKHCAKDGGTCGVCRK